jgi:hypothetical protein
MLIATADVIRAAVVLSVPQAAAGIVTAANAAPAIRRTGIPVGLSWIRRDVSSEAGDVG